MRYFPQVSSAEEGANFWDRTLPALQPSTFLYVDDITLFDVIPLEEDTRHYTTGPTKEVFESLALGRDL